MSMRRQHKYGMSKCEYASQACQFKAMHYGTVLRAISVPYQDYFHCQNPVLGFRGGSMGMDVEDILLLDEECSCTRIYLLFSHVRHGRTLFLTHFYFAYSFLTHSLMQPYGCAGFPVFSFFSYSLHSHIPRV